MEKDPENIVVLEINGQKVEIAMLNDKAPNHIERIKMLASEGFYDGCPFHRVIDGFMAQTGDGQNQDGTGGSDYPDLQSEFNDVKHERGVVSMARAASPHSANSQFFICFSDQPHLDGQYTAFGKVLKGMEVIDNVKRGALGSGSVESPDVIEKAYVLSDA